MLSLFLLFFLLLISLSLGATILNVFRLVSVSGEEMSLQDCLFAIGLGLAVIAYGVYLVGLLGFLYKSVLWGLLFVLTLFLAKDILVYLRVFGRGLRSLGQIFRFERGNSFIIIVLILLVLDVILNLIGALAPEIIFDAIWYHLALPKIYLQNHRIFFVPHVLYAAFPRVMEMLYTLALGLHSDIVAKLLHFSMGLLVVLTVYSLSRKFFSKEVSLLAGVIFYGMQPVNMLSATAYVDLGLTFFELLAVYAFVNWLYARNSRWLLLSGVLTGVALGVKHQAILLALVLTACLILEFVINRKEKSVKGLAKNLFAYGCCALVVVMPWYIDSFLRTGNPVYPLFNTFFGTGASYEKAMFASTGKESWYHGHSLLEYFTLLWKFTMGKYEGWLSPLLLFFLPLAFFVKRRTKAFKLSLIFSGLFYTAYFAIVPFYTVRYFLPMVPVLSIACAYIREEISGLDRFVKQFCAVIVVFVLLANLGVLFFKNMSSFPVVFGLESREQYLSQSLGWYEVNRFIEEEIPNAGKVLVSGAPLFYYFDFDYAYGAGSEAKSYREKAIALKKEGFTHMLLLVGAVDDPEEAKYFRLVYSRDIPQAARSNAARGAKLYRIEVK